MNIKFKYKLIGLRQLSSQAKLPSPTLQMFFLLICCITVKKIKIVIKIMLFKDCVENMFFHSMKTLK